MKVMMQSGFIALTLISGCAQAAQYGTPTDTAQAGKTAQDGNSPQTADAFAVEVLPSQHAPIPTAPFQAPKPKPAPPIQSGNDFNWQAGGNS